MSFCHTRHVGICVLINSPAANKPLAISAVHYLWIRNCCTSDELPCDRRGLINLATWQGPSAAHACQLSAQLPVLGTAEPYLFIRHHLHQHLHLLTKKVSLHVLPTCLPSSKICLTPDTCDVHMMSKCKVHMMSKCQVHMTSKLACAS